jgi:hypothetical protein
MGDPNKAMNPSVFPQPSVFLREERQKSNKSDVSACTRATWQTSLSASRRVASRRVEPGVRNAFWDSAKSTVILIRVATGRHLNARAQPLMHAVLRTGGIIRRDFCNSHLCSALYTENRTGKSSQAEATSSAMPPTRQTFAANRDKCSAPYRAASSRANEVRSPGRASNWR